MYLGEKLGTYGVRLWVFARDGFLVHFKIGSGRVVGLALPSLFPHRTQHVVVRFLGLDLRCLQFILIFRMLDLFRYPYEICDFLKV
jgi:hypothetical protein